MIVAIHQPNYFPWLGYFRKMIEADVFIFLDDVQFSKGSYTNRVGIRSGSGRRWLTVTVNVKFGQLISEVSVAKVDWIDRHLEILRNTYKECPYFGRVWPDIEAAYVTLKSAKLSEINIHLIQHAAHCLNIETDMRLASTLNVSGKSDDRLIALLGQVSPGCVYLSGEGGGNYQSDDKFRMHGFDIRYVSFQHPEYSQYPSAEPFQAGLSILDAAFNLGWEQTADLLKIPERNNRRAY